MSPAVSIDKLTYGYQDAPVLNDVSFDIAPETFFIIIGPNGSGKTTILKLITGLLPAKQGRIRVFERPVDAYSHSSLARVVAFVPQITTLEAPFTVREFVLLGRAPHLGLLGVESRRDLDLAEEAMQVTHVDHLARRKMNRLSGGELQRVFIARAVCQQSNIILLDEPTAFLDLAHQMRVMDLMERLRKERGITVIMVSHDINLAAMYAGVVLLLKSGQIAGMGPPARILTAEKLEAVYGCKIQVIQNPVWAFSNIFPVPGKFLEQKQSSS